MNVLRSTVRRLPPIQPERRLYQAEFSQWMGMEIRPRPEGVQTGCVSLLEDDTVHSQFEIDGIDHRRGKEWGRLRVKVRLINQRGEIVLAGRHVYAIRYRVIDM